MVDLQSVIVGIVVAIAVAYLIFSIWRVVRRFNDSTKSSEAGCDCSEGCSGCTGCSENKPKCGDHTDEKKPTNRL